MRSSPPKSGGGGSQLFSTAGMAGTDGQPNAMAASGGPASSCSLAEANVDRRLHDATGRQWIGGATLAGAQAGQTGVSCGGGGGGGAGGVFSPTFTPTNLVTSPAHQLNPF